MVKSPEALFELIPQAFSAHAIPGSNRPEVTISGYRPSKDLAVRDDGDFFNTRYPWDRTLISSRDKPPAQRASGSWRMILVSPIAVQGLTLYQGDGGMGDEN